jgi:SSU ribosomal protein S12P methylthiotransferase (EC 2.-.-.-)
MTTINVHTVSLGCPKNRVDTERMLGALGADMAAVDDPRDADLILVNTCGFIRPAVEESVSTVLELAETVRDAEHRPVLAVTGCLVSRYGDELRAELPEVDLWLSTRESAQWPALAAQALARRGFRDSGRSPPLHRPGFTPT